MKKIAINVKILKNNALENADFLKKLLIFHLN